MALTGNTVPRLGIDLAGGTSVTLTAAAADKGAVSAQAMGTAVSILQKRVNGMGVSEAEVHTQGRDTIIVNIPRGAGQQAAVDQIGTTAKLFFRPVLASAAVPSAAALAAVPGKPAADGPGAAPVQGQVPEALRKQFAALDCNNPAQRVDHQGAATSDSVACSYDQEQGIWSKFVLGPVAVDGQAVAKAAAALDQEHGGGWQVQLSFDGAGTKAFGKVTGALSAKGAPDNQLAIVLDGRVVSHPQVQASIGTGTAVVSGNFTQGQAQDLANVLSYGALPLTFVQSDVTTVSPQLGGDQLQAGLIAGAIGLALVVLYCLAYYRGLGLVAVAGLAVSAAMTYAIMSLLGAAIGFALNLPAVCGAIVAIGITADSFIVYFERIRDFLRDGSPLRSAVQRAWPRARRTILVSDFVSFLAAAVLYVVSVGKVQGFAFTLGLTTVLDIVVIVLFTKPVITLLARTKFFAGGHRWSGVDAGRLVVRPPLRGRRSAGRSTDGAGPVSAGPGSASVDEREGVLR